MLKQNKTLMPSSLRGITTRALGQRVKKRILTEAKVGNSNLQGAERRKDFVSLSIQAAIYKDLHAVSYSDLSDQTVSLFPGSDRTLRTNVQSIRKKLRRWSDQVLVPESVDNLKKRAKNQRKVRSFGTVHLWVDTTEFRLTGKSTMRRKDERWSHKVNGPGRKWLFLHDANGRVVYVAGPFYPKTYDSDAMIYEMRRIEKRFPGTRIIGDNHFRKASQFAKRIEIITNVSKAGRPKIVQGRKQQRELSTEEKRHNKDVSLIRARVEPPYGNWQNKFAALAKPFYEGPDQLDCLVRTAAAVHRLRKND